VRKLVEIISDLVALKVEMAIDSHEESRHDSGGVWISDSRRERLAKLEQELSDWEDRRS
jgi:hypothetical protein